MPRFMIHHNMYNNDDDDDDGAGSGGVETGVGHVKTNALGIEEDQGVEDQVKRVQWSGEKKVS